MSKKTLQSVQKALDILETLATQNKGFNLTQLAKKLDLANSTTHRVLDTLRRQGYVEQNPESQKYSLSIKILQLSSMLLGQMDVREKALPILEEVAKKTGESVRLAILSDSEVVYIECVESSQTLQVRGFIGKKVFIHTSAVGKVLLAYLPEERIDRIINNRGLPRCTKYTITDPHKLKEHLRKVRQQGFAIDNEEGTIGSRCISAPIFNYSGKIIAAVSIAGPSLRITPEHFDRLVRIVKEASREISYKTGGEKTKIFGGKL